jgi:hypothetical protein
VNGDLDKALDIYFNDDATHVAAEKNGKTSDPAIRQAVEAKVQQASQIGAEHVEAGEVQSEDEIVDPMPVAVVKRKVGRPLGSKNKPKLIAEPQPRRHLRPRKK